MQKIVKSLCVYFIFAISFSFFSCKQQVHTERIKIYCIYNEKDGVGGVIPVPEQKTIELPYSQPTKVNLLKIGFERIRYNDVPYIGYMDGEKVYVLKQEKGLCGAIGYVFEIEQTAERRKKFYWNSADSLGISNVNLYPVYELLNPESDSDSPIVPVQKPGVELIIKYNHHITGEVVESSIPHFYTIQDPSVKTLRSLSLTPSALNTAGEWRIHADDGDRMYYGYVDPEDYNRAYYFDNISQDPLIEDYTFVDQEDRVYNLDTVLDPNRYTVLRPLYVRAGFVTNYDDFGEKVNGEHLKLSLAYIPGTYNELWPYEEAGSTVSNSVNQYFFAYPDDPVQYPNASGSKSGVFFDYMTDKSPTEDVFATDIMISQDFLYELLYNRSNIFKTPEVGEFRVTSQSGVYTFTFKQASIDTNSGLKDYERFNVAWEQADFGTAAVMANFLTIVYNMYNPENPLDCVYYTDPTFTTILNNYNDGNTVNVYTKPNATGYRLPYNHEFSYWAKVILDDRLLCSIPPTSTADSSVVYSPLILLNTMLGTTYSYKSVQDDDYWGSVDYYLGTCAGLSHYRSDGYTSKYKKNEIRLGPWGYLGNLADSDDDPDSPRDSNLSQIKPNYLDNRNGAGLYFLMGLKYQWIDAWADCRKDNTPLRICRGGDYSCICDSSSGSAKFLRIPSVFALPANTYPAAADGTDSNGNRIGVRYCRTLERK